MAINLEFDNYEEVISFIQREKDLLFTETLNEIKESIKNDKKILTHFFASIKGRV